MMLGLRGFPDVQGGVETHAEHLCALLVQRGWRVDAIARTAYVPPTAPRTWKGIRIIRLWAPRSRSFETMLHTTLGVLYAAFSRPDILHIQAIGPGLLAPLAKLCGLRVVFTHHGPDYDRQKWGRAARWFLELGERLGVKFADATIVISQTIQTMVAAKYRAAAHLIPNGVSAVDVPATATALERFGLTAQRYVLLVSRLVPEKRHLDLIAAFQQAGLDDWKLVIVGSADHQDAYGAAVRQAAREQPRVIMAGFQSGLALSELYAHAGLFVLPSSHEGLPIALLEALSFGLPVVASDIPANLEVGLAAEHHFPLGDVRQLSLRLRDFAARPFDAAQRAATRAWVLEKYSWEKVAQSTDAVYRSVLDG